MTLLCVPIMVDDPAHALDDADAAKRAGADAVEFRFDALFGSDVDAAGLDHARRIVRESPLPVIATCRAASEGGEWTGSEDARIELFEAVLALDAPARWIDVELDAWRASATLRARIGAALDRVNEGAPRDEPRTGLILSTHDFSGRPADLLRRLRAMAEEPRAAVHKVAFRARSLRDNLEIADLLAHRAAPTIALAMGEFGLPSRVLAPKWGGFLTFASLRAGEESAPGQPTIDDLLNRCRLREIGRSTRVFGVAGWPVAQSLSPLVHNAGLREAGVDGVYLALPIPPEWEHFKATVGALAAHPLFDLGGLSVTAPHKTHLVRLAREEGWSVEPRAERIGAANTLVLSGRGDARVLDTDGPAVVSLLREALGDVRGRTLLLLGAGGVARSIGSALVDAGGRVRVRARRSEQADELRTLLGVRDSDDGAPPDALVHCTPAGMLGGDEGTLGAPEKELDALARENPSLVVLDTVYRPLETPLLAWARSRGLRVIDGASMFVGQAEGQFAVWTGRPPQAGLFSRLVRERLSGEKP